MQKQQEQLDTFAQALDCQPKFVAARLHALGHHKVCTRCGGTGQYSFNMMDGTKCYGCMGSGWQMPKLTPALLEIVRAEVAAGGLEPYFAKVRQHREIRRLAKQWFDLWRDLPAVIDSDAAAKAAGKTGWSHQTDASLWTNGYAARLTDFTRTYNLTDDATLERMAILIGLIQQAPSLLPEGISHQAHTRAERAERTTDYQKEGRTKANELMQAAGIDTTAKG